jgi:alkylation response protein AidB-like acyl-CoA dehydrogenase
MAPSVTEEHSASELPPSRLPASLSGTASNALFEVGEGSLLAAIEAIAETLQLGAAASDAEGRLVDASVDALRSHGLWRMRLCRELGGLEVPIVAQIRAIAALAAEDASSAWCTMIANHAVAMLGATMPPGAIERIFAEGVPSCSIVANPGGVVTPVEGGYTVSGVWRLASSIHHASWVYALGYIERDPSRLLPLAIPAADVELLKSWNVVGLAGTGSNDFKLENYFLPSVLTGREDNPFAQVRGTRRYDLVALEHVESYEHLAFALGVGRRAIRELQKVLAKPLGGRHVADREIVRQRLGQLVVQLQAAEALAYALYRRVDGAAIGEVQLWSQADHYQPRAVAVWATQAT